jgi:PAS domain S-box-containing protein
MKTYLSKLTLSFAGEQEREYQMVFFRNSLPVLRVAMILSIMLFAAFGLLDLLLVKDHLSLFLFMRFGIAIPLFLVVYFLSFTKTFQFVWQLLLFLSVLAGGVIIIIMIAIAPENWSYYGGLMLVFMAGYFFIRLRFYLASLAGWLLTVIFGVSILFLAEITPELIVPYVLFFVSANLIGMFASYYIEVADRKNYILTHQLEEKQREQIENNKELELMVKLRTMELRESEERFRNLADLLPLMVFEVDLQGKINYANEEAMKETGLTREQIVKGALLSNIIPPEDRKKVFSDFDNETILEGKSKTEYRIMRYDGTLFPVIDYSNAIIKDDQVIGLRSILVDVSEQKKAEQALKLSEERYKLLSDNAFDGIYLSYGHRLEYVNKVFCEVSGYSEEEILSEDFHFNMLLTPESIRIIEERKKARMDGKDVSQTVELKVITKSGVVKDVELGAVMISKEPELLLLGVVRDITERKVNEKLRNEVILARQSAEFKQQFLANMSHEIRTPLTGIMGIIEVLSSTNLDEQQMEYLKTLELSTENLREIINQILDYSKIEAGKVLPRPIIFDSRGLFDNARNLFGSICRKPIQLEINLSENIPKHLKSDEARVNQVITNLLSNAVKFTNEGTISLTADIHKWIDENTLEIKIEVSDTGIGIKKEKLKLLFRPFTQVDHKDTRDFEGTGLGLSICRELVKLMGGRIGVRSKPGQGSTFWFSFKAEIAKLEEIPRNTEKKRKGENIVPLRIMIVEDKLVNQKVIGLILTAMGHTITTANNGKEALENFTPEACDLILMDIQMPVMDGITATQILKKNYNNLPPIVGLSANAFEGDREKYMAMGMDEYLTKPVRKEDFTKLLVRIGLRN